MIIALHGGFSMEMIYGFGAALATIAVFLIYIHYRLYRSEYYNEEYVYFSSWKKLFLYIGFLIVSLFIAIGLFCILSFLFIGIAVAVRK
ncbi:hypothetical protein EYY60_10565 [Flavobacterium zhairuonense]|uniref:hypothetical protein n=1 Tax=Flavobacterium zhairuonense TaxID=2493631 RepID=UPI0010465FC9|nr:hypothetical protein [Flavobacterium zhairuonense]KAF2509957.1 hypothetical protein EYY60_10565 [Flavobacterium zhairuonense]